MTEKSKSERVNWPFIKRAAVGALIAGIVAAALRWVFG